MWLNKDFPVTSELKYLKNVLMLGTLVHTCRVSCSEAEAGELRVLGQPDQLGGGNLS